MNRYFGIRHAVDGIQKAPSLQLRAIPLRDSLPRVCQRGAGQGRNVPRRDRTRQNAPVANWRYPANPTAGNSPPSTAVRRVTSPPGRLHVTPSRNGLGRTLTVLMAVLLCGTQYGGVLAGGQAADGQTPSGTTVVALRVELVSGEQATLKARNGDRMTVTRADGQSVALSPVILGDQLEVRLTDLSVVGTERELPPVTLVQGVVFPLSGVPLLSTVTWVSLTAFTPTTQSAGQCARPGANRALASGTPPPPQPDSPCSICCVSCGDMTYCGCNQVTGCGSCCCPNGCGC